MERSAPVKSDRPVVAPRSTPQVPGGRMGGCSRAPHGVPRTVLGGLLGAVATVALAASPVSDDPHRGGSLRLLSTTWTATLDPQVNYTAQFSQVFQGVYDGLLAFNKGPGPDGFVIVPDLAQTLPRPENGGRRYVFTLRPGLHFSDGRVVTVLDVAASLRRLFKVSSPTAGSLFSVIVGADACLKDPARCTLEGGVSADPTSGTVTINLTRADPDFFYKLALGHASVLPADAPPRDAAAQPIPGTGAYRVAAYDPRKRLQLLRNPYFRLWSADAQPDGYVDEVDYDFGLSDEEEVAAIANGRADWMFNAVPPDRLNEINTKFPQQVHVSPLTALYYLPMNTRRAPFDQLKARQAVNFAIDRAAVVKLYGGSQLAVATCQILPPDLPGHRPYCPYTLNPGTRWSAPDVARAKQLVRESGTAGQRVTLVTEDSSVGKQIGLYVQSVLDQIGYDASLKVLASNLATSYLAHTANQYQIGLSTWYQDYPAASDFLDVLFSCASLHTDSDASVNLSQVCDKGLEADLARALAADADASPGAKDQWAAIDRRVTDLAAVVPLFNPKQLDFVSRRLGHYVYSGEYYFLFGQAWVH